MSDKALSPRHIVAAKDDAVRLVARIKAAHTNNEISKMQDIEDRFGLDLDSLSPTGVFSPEGRAQVIQRWFLDVILQKFIDDTGIRLMKAASTVVDTKRLRLTPERECFKFPNSDVTLFPEQDAACKEIYARMFEQKEPIDHVLVPGGTGAGKTIIGVRWMYQLIHQQRYHLPPDILPVPLPVPLQWVTVPNAVEQTREELVRCGLGAYLDKSIFVYGYNSLSCSEGIGRFTEVEYKETADFESEDGDITTKRLIKWIRFSTPRGIVIDECHKLANEESGVSQTFADLREAIKEMPFLATKGLWLSATPFEKLTDSKTFVTFAGINYAGVRVTANNFITAFANPISKGKPDVVTAASMERLFNVLERNVVEIPYIAWPRRAINAVKVCQFESEADRDYVNGAWERHLERCRAVGKDTPQGFGAVYASFTIFRKDVEHVRIPQIVREMVDNVRAGNSSVCGTAFTGAIIKGIFKLLDEYGVSRDQISVIWGGRQNIQPARVLNQAEMVQIVQEAIESGEGLSLENRRLIKRNLAWQEDQLLFGDSTAEIQDARYARLKALGLIGIQTKQRRSFEISKMKDGTARYCFFTLQSGGTGLSLPHADARTTPRVGWFSPIYSGKEFTQAFGRLPRRVSISDTYQYCCVLDGTIESEHVAPILDNKLQAAGAFTSKKTDIMAALTDLFIDKKADFMMKREFGRGTIRDIDTARKQAIEDEATQYHGGDVVDDEDDE